MSISPGGKSSSDIYDLRGPPPLVPGLRFFAAILRAGALRATVRFLAAVLRAGALLAVAFRLTAFLAAVRLAGALRADAFFAAGDTSASSASSCWLVPAAEATALAASLPRSVLVIAV